LLVALFVLSGHQNPSGGPGEGCDFESEFSFGIRSIDQVSGWSPFCNYEAGDDWFNPSGTEVDLFGLVNLSYGISSTNDWN